MIRRSGGSRRASAHHARYSVSFVMRRSMRVSPCQIRQEGSRFARDRVRLREVDAREAAADVPVRCRRSRSESLDASGWAPSGPVPRHQCIVNASDASNASKSSKASRQGQQCKQDKHDKQDRQDKQDKQRTRQAKQAAYSDAVAVPCKVHEAVDDEDNHRTKRTTAAGEL